MKYAFLTLAALFGSVAPPAAADRLGTPTPEENAAIIAGMGRAYVWLCTETAQENMSPPPIQFAIYQTGSGDSVTYTHYIIGNDYTDRLTRAARVAGDHFDYVRADASIAIGPSGAMRSSFTGPDGKAITRPGTCILGDQG